MLFKILLINKNNYANLKVISYNQHNKINNYIIINNY